MDEIKRLLFQFRRYMFLQGPSDGSFWGELAENCRCPAEANSIISKLDDSHIYID